MQRKRVSITEHERMIDQYDTIYFLPWDELPGSQKEAWLKVGHWVAEQVRKLQRNALLQGYAEALVTPARRSAISPPENFGRLSAPRGNAAQIIEMIIW